MLLDKSLSYLKQRQEIELMFVVASDIDISLFQIESRNLQAYLILLSINISHQNTVAYLSK